MAEGAGGNHCVGTQFACGSGVVGYHPQGVALVDEQYREAAAGGLAGEVDDVAADRLDHGFERCLAFRVFVEAQCVGGSNDVAAVEGRKVDSRKLLDERLFERLNADIFNEHPKQMLYRGVAAV